MFIKYIKDKIRTQKAKELKNSLIEAEKIYLDFNDLCIEYEGIIYKPISCLRNTKQIIKTSINALLIVHRHFNPELFETEEEYKTYIGVLVCRYGQLAFFIEDKLAIKLNNMHEKLGKLADDDRNAFFESNKSLSDEVSKIAKEVSRLEEEARKI